MLDKVREWISDNLRYILLGLAAILLIIIVVIAVRGATHSGSSDKKESSAVVETELQTEEETEDEESLVRNETDVLNTAKEYWAAVRDKDYDTLEKLCDKEFDDEDKEKIDEMDTAVESYDNIATYSKPGLTDGSYAVYVYMDLKLTGIETEAPTLREMYMETGDDGDLVVIQKDDYTSAISEFMNERVADSDVQALITEVNNTLSELCEQDEDLANYVNPGSSSDSDNEDALAGEDVASSDDSGSSDSTGQTATVSDGVNVRSEASTDSEILSALYAGLQVNVLETLDDGWAKISFIDESGNTVTGYVKSEFLNM